MNKRGRPADAGGAPFYGLLERQGMEVELVPRVVPGST